MNTENARLNDDFCSLLQFEVLVNSLRTASSWRKSHFFHLKVLHEIFNQNIFFITFSRGHGSLSTTWAIKAISLCIRNIQIDIKISNSFVLRYTFLTTLRIIEKLMLFVEWLNRKRVWLWSGCINYRVEQCLW